MSRLKYRKEQAGRRQGHSERNRAERCFQKRYPEEKTSAVFTLPLCMYFLWLQNKATYLSAFHIYPRNNLVSELTDKLTSLHENVLKLCRLFSSQSLTLSLGIKYLSAQKSQSLCIHLGLQVQHFSLRGIQMFICNQEQYLNSN